MQPDGMEECSICAQEFTDPRALPCLHTFCLNCLEEHYRDKSPGDTVECPLCNYLHTLPPQGLGSLPKNFFIRPDRHQSNVQLTRKSTRLSAEDSSRETAAMPAFVEKKGEFLGNARRTARLPDDYSYEDYMNAGLPTRNWSKFAKNNCVTIDMGKEDFYENYGPTGGRRADLWERKNRAQMSRTDYKWNPFQENWEQNTARHNPPAQEDFFGGGLIYTLIRKLFALVCLIFVFQYFFLPAKPR